MVNDSGLRPTGKTIPEPGRTQVGALTAVFLAPGAALTIATAFQSYFDSSKRLS